MPVRALVFDMGGVLVELGDPTEVFGLDAGLDVFLERWIRSPAVRDFERGLIDAEAFATRILAEVQLPYGESEFLTRFDRWPRGLFPGVQDIMRRIRPEFGRALLSNTNEAHWRHAGQCRLAGQFVDRSFLSFETGLMKPDAEAYLHVARELGVEPAEVAFFDDNPVNVDGALAVGMRAMLARGPAELESALLSLGALD